MILTDHYWHDAAGQLLAQQKAGSHAFEKMAYDSLGRLATRSLACNPEGCTTATAGSVSTDFVLQQVALTYDEGGNLIQQSTRERFHDATGDGPLQGPTGTEPRARLSHRAFWHDGLGRQVIAADYGTHGGESFTRPAAWPEETDPADPILITKTTYNDAGQAHLVTDPNGVQTWFGFDQAGRLVRKVENYTTTEEPTTENRVTSFTYNADGKLAELVAWLGAESQQVTRFLYGVTLSGSAIQTNELLRTKIYPESEDPGTGVDEEYDRVDYDYNRLGELTGKTDQRQVKHEYVYDGLGRLVHDCVATIPDPDEVDGTVARISTSYNALGLVETVTSWSNSVPENGSPLNQVQKEYNASGQLIKEWQSHGGAVEEESTPKVEYGYEDGTDNTIRPTSLTYPSTRALNYSYGDTEQLDHLLSRVWGITDDDETELARYAYLGAGTVVRVEYPQPEVELTYLKQGAEGNGEAGDQYAGLDRFGRIVDQRWIQGTTALERLKYGYDHAGNRLWKENVVSKALGTPVYQDEAYTYDGLYQLKDFQRGTLNSQHSTINDPPAWQEALTYDAQGNWANYLTKTGGVTDLNQDRVHNLANEITEIASSADHIAHDKAGNMIKTPKPGNWTAHYELKWDAWNRLVQVSGIGPNGNETVQYAYDGQSRRITKTQGASVRHYYYSARWQVIEERVEDTEEEETILDRQLVWGLRHIDDLVLRDSGLSGTSTRLYGLHDHLSLTAVVNTSGVVQERYRYTAFGQKTLLNPDFSDRTSSTLDWETGFHCYRWDGETGLSQVRYRYLHPGLGRWISRDPLNEHGLRFALPCVDPLPYYVFAKNLPILLIDFLGLITFDTKTCKQSDIESLIKGLKDRCKKATDKNCFRCLSKPRQKDMENFCKNLDDQKGQPYVICEDQKSAPKECGSNWGGWTDTLNRIHICMNNQQPTQEGCFLLHEAAHSVGGVGYDDTEAKKKKLDMRAYAIQKCAGCYIDPKLSLPASY